MSLDSLNDLYFNDEEVFFGRLSLNEIKFHILPTKQRNSAIGCSLHSETDDSSLRLIETTSEPSLLHINDSTSLMHRSVGSLPDLTLNNSNVESWDTKTSDESFIKMECMFAKMHDTKAPENECDNTFDEVDRMLKEAQRLQYENENSDIKNANIKKDDCFMLNSPSLSSSEVLIHSSGLMKNPLKERVNTNDIKKQLFPKENKIPKIMIQSPTLTGEQHEDIFCTPLKSTENLNTENTVFKTPANQGVKKLTKSSVKRTLLKYDYIKSPVASYIRDGPQVPLMKDVRPKRPLPGSSAIPKFVKSPIRSNKENINLPHLAYRSAKETKVVSNVAFYLANC